MRLLNKVSIITGASSGIGREAARLFAREGAKVVVADIREEGEKVAGEIKDRGGDAIFVKVDVSSRAEVGDMVENTLGTYGRIDVLINNAGIIRDSTLLKMREEQWDDVIRVNLKGVYNCSQAVARVMVEQGDGGVIINTSSVVALYGNYGQTNYVASKAGLIGFTKSLARELGRKGIRVNAVAPGFIETPMTARVPEKVLDLVKSRIPLGRMGKPEDVARVYLFLASEEASYITGAVISVDGGLVL